MITLAFSASTIRSSSVSICASASFNCLVNIALSFRASESRMAQASLNIAFATAKSCPVGCKLCMISANPLSIRSRGIDLRLLAQPRVSHR
ncbi:hypothetical protein [Sedimentitalea arenosa]|uniref:hypothetical protein n=1 Tax=Sedimentitalea arenosa TaxID=2798803 RepID=UPI001E65E1A9|nr:hypothetical protein [Arenibacterium arenosum]